MKIAVSWIPRNTTPVHCHYATTTHRNGLVVMVKYTEHDTILEETSIINDRILAGDGFDLKYSVLRIRSDI